MTDFDGVKTKWLNEFLEDNIASVAYLTPLTPNWENKASIFADKLSLTLCDRQLVTPSQQKNARSQVAHVLRQYHPQHPAIAHPYVLLSSLTYTQLNIEQLQKTDERQTLFFSGAEAIALVDKAASLIESNDPNEVAAGLAVLIGRRISEILISQFDPCTPYSIWFSEPVKKSSLMPPLEIPTLIEADQVLAAIARLRDIWHIDDLMNEASSERQLKQAINRRYENVPKAVRRHYKDLIPGRKADNDSGEKLYTHIFRAVYAEIATYFYKPSTIPTHRFKAEIQGHFSINASGKVRSYTSRPHYDDYLISDRLPDQDGIKLSLDDVSVLSTFSDKDNDEDKEKPSPTVIPTNEPNNKSEPKTNMTEHLYPQDVLTEKEWVSSGVLSKGTNSEPRTPNPEPQTPNSELMITMLQQQYDLAVQSNQEKYQAIIEGKDALLAEKDNLIEDKSKQVDFLSEQLKLANERTLNHSLPDLSSLNKQLHLEIKTLNTNVEQLEQKLLNTESERDDALNKVAELEGIIEQFKTLLDPNHTNNNHKNPNTHQDNSTTHHQSEKSSDTLKKTPRSQLVKDLDLDPRADTVDRAINAIKTYNNDPNRTYQEKWYISNPMVADLIRSSGFQVSGKFLQEYLRYRSVDLEQHHQFHQLSVRHNAKHDQPISNFITIN